MGLIKAIGEFKEVREEFNYNESGVALLTLVKAATNEFVVLAGRKVDPNNGMFSDCLVKSLRRMAFFWTRMMSGIDPVFTFVTKIAFSLN